MQKIKKRKTSANQDRNAINNYITSTYAVIIMEKIKSKPLSNEDSNAIFNIPRPPKVTSPKSQVSKPRSQVQEIK